MKTGQPTTQVKQASHHRMAGKTKITPPPETRGGLTEEAAKTLLRETCHDRTWTAHGVQLQYRNEGEENRACENKLYEGATECEKGHKPDGIVKF